MWRLVEIFGCGCVPSTQANMLNIPFNANDLRMTVFSLLTIVLSIWSIRSVYKELHADRETGC